MLKGKIEFEGKTRSDILDAIDEARASIERENTSGFDRNESSNYSFEIEGEEDLDLQVIADAETADEITGATRGWIVPAGTKLADDLELAAVDHVDIPACEDEAQWMQGMRDELAAAGYDVEGDIGCAGSIATAAVTRRAR